MCGACEHDDHANCGLQTWCDCECDGTSDWDWGPMALHTEFRDCPRNKWYAAEGRRLRKAGWVLRKDGPKWNLTHALIQRDAPSVEPKGPKSADASSNPKSDSGERGGQA
jgi:hypothetical protein